MLPTKYNLPVQHMNQPYATRARGVQSAVVQKQMHARYSSYF